MKDNAYIYFLSNHHNNVLYIGVTNDIIRRIAEHKAKINKGFTYKYNCDKLVYYKIFSLITAAISREKQLKNWKREWKNKLIHDFNPEWKDLSKEIGVDDAFIEAVKAEYNRHADPNGHAELVSASLSNREIAGQARNDDYRPNGHVKHSLQNELLNFETKYGKK
jgi:putative endonuclease